MKLEPDDVVTFDPRWFPRDWHTTAVLVEDTGDQWKAPNGSPGGPVWIVEVMVEPDEDAPDDAEPFAWRTKSKVGPPYTIHADAPPPPWAVELRGAP